MSRTPKLFAGAPVVRGVEVYEFPKKGGGGRQFINNSTSILVADAMALAVLAAPGAARALSSVETQ